MNLTEIYLFPILLIQLYVDVDKNWEANRHAAMELTDYRINALLDRLYNLTRIKVVLPPSE